MRKREFTTSLKNQQWFFLTRRELYALRSAYGARLCGAHLYHTMGPNYRHILVAPDGSPLTVQHAMLCDVLATMGRVRHDTGLNNTQRLAYLKAQREAHRKANADANAEKAA